MADPLTPALVANAARHADRLAIVDANGDHSYRALLDASAAVASGLLAGRNKLAEERIAFLIKPGFAWVATQWAIWRAGGIAVPLPQNTPAAELQYFIDDTGASALVADTSCASVLAPMAEARAIPLFTCDELMAQATVPLPSVPERRRAMILYTSGTTSRPKGVVTTHANIAAQITALIAAWEWSADDRIVLCLPLHHVHGIVNVLSCALWAGAVCEMLPRFDAEAVWERLASGEVTVFMAVPTIYVKLIAAWEAAPPARQQQLTEAARRLRLMVSGSAALPVSVLERWREITGHTLLERYGMTEIGMALSNSYRGPRIPGTVGKPLPGVDVQLVSEDGTAVAPGVPGQIEVRGPNVFQEYWGKPDATREAFRDGWFRTGDTAVVENGSYRILGRTNIDILKTGGHKVSALEIEEILRQHSSIIECAVVGVPDPEWGERVAAAIVGAPNHGIELESLREWCRPRLAAHKIPSRLLMLDELPRNAMGKVTKPAVIALFHTTHA